MPNQSDRSVLVCVQVRVWDGAYGIRAMRRVCVKRVCNDKGSTNRVACLGRPCTYAIVKCTTGVCGAPAGTTGSGMSWLQALALAIEKACAVGWNQETADLVAPDRKNTIQHCRTKGLPVTLEEQEISTR